LQIAGSSLGVSRSEETRAKISASMLGNSNGIKQAQKIEVLGAPPIKIKYYNYLYFFF